jgi:hypothetical protein
LNHHGQQNWPSSPFAMEHLGVFLQLVMFKVKEELQKHIGQENHHHHWIVVAIGSKFEYLLDITF